MTKKSKHNPKITEKKNKKSHKTEKISKLIHQRGYSKTATAAICYWYNNSNR